MENPVTRPRTRFNANRVRILDAAMVCFASDPDSSMDDVARAAGVVRRTVYAHFPNREALVEGIADDAASALARALDHPEPEDAAVGLAVEALRTWPIGDRYRVLLSFARREMGEQRIADLIAPVRSRVLGLVERGRAQGQFSGYLPAAVLVGMMEGLTMATLEQANMGLVDDSGDTIVLGNLVLAGVSPDRAPEILAAARQWLEDAAPDDDGGGPR
ncbi:TetR/AcrR family transcriptional regulator [Rhodococcus sp. NPDC047139]|uniref:TetR/AcrR family transcriptional regulator n=1 Tax=Rhodococcus sp. NPDC047139 TaxID=3155141 RepID=UPI0033D8B154